MDQTEKEFATKSKLSKLEEFVARQYGRTANAVLADIDAGRQFKSLPQALQPGVIPVNRQLLVPSSQNKDRPTVHENKLKTAYLKEIVFRPISSQSAQSYFFQTVFEDDVMGRELRSLHVSNATNNLYFSIQKKTTRGRKAGPLRAAQPQQHRVEPVTDVQSYTLKDKQPTNGPILEQLQPQYRAPACYNVDLLRANLGTSPTPNVNHFASHSNSSSINLPNSQGSNEGDNEPIIDLSSLIAESAENSRKRVRIDDILNDQHDFRTTRKRSARTKRDEAKIRELREIVGRRGRGPVDFIELAEEIKVPINLLDLFQISPGLVKNFKKISIRTNQKQKNKENKDNLKTLASLVDANENHSENSVPAIDPDDKAFRIPTVFRIEIKGKYKRVRLPKGASQADQGSDINLCSPSLASTFGAKIKKLSNHR
ncbi:hypothetical protein K3495_g11378 [Podosphaera aphanis]|nr:hypothetical protein K3495_g11378 [Podosphaera aphanis]